MSLSENSNRSRGMTRDIAVYAMLGCVMFCSKIVMEALPNIHLLGMLTMVYTVVLRSRALIPIYIYVILNGIFAGFSPWWIPYLYIWTLLWGVTMLLPKSMNSSIAAFVYPAVCALHGLLYGTLYAPAQAIMFGLDLEKTVAWIIAGIPFDITHCFGNLIAGLLILPFSKVLKKLFGRK